MRDIGAPELMIVLVVCVLMFGSKKLPDLARGSGRALRIFRSEVRDTADDVESPPLSPSPGLIDAEFLK
ncbi:twin-arginine translocase TatA/TatE family subunit [Nocardioides marmorisolisilvae]|uniref:Sec-independent protein translocase protein TatA n=2 Tax=Nocardioides marmorisolisilvae TaxID=1542737 RepID=A0A3N0DX64_9ACTN|nr:twin-arginine translocase TatA/TatE family subunit [Nocardioides marmorisolisilvae]